MRAAAVASALALLAAQSGCGTSVPDWRLPEPPPEDVRRAVTRVAVMLEGDPLGFPSPPLAGACTMAAVGALGGMGIGAGAGLVVLSALRHTGSGECAALVAFLVVLAAAAVAAVAIPLGGLIGGIAGSSEGRPSDEVERGRAVLQRAVDGAGVPQTLRASVLDVLSRETDLRLVDPASADAVLMIGRPTIGLAGPRRVDPPLRLYGEVTFRLLRPLTGRQLHAITLGFASEPKLFQEWTAGEGALAGAELTRGTSRFAERAVEEFFLLEWSAR